MLTLSKTYAVKTSQPLVEHKDTAFLLLFSQRISYLSVNDKTLHAMRKLNFFPKLFLLCLTVPWFPELQAQQNAWSKTDKGIQMAVQRTHGSAATFVKVQVITDKIFRVTACVSADCPDSGSLMVVDRKRPEVKWTALQENDSVSLSTSALTARISVRTGDIAFYRNDGTKIISEEPGGRTLEPTVINGEPKFRPAQFFTVSDDEGWYGLGQHQSGVMNYRGTQVELAQYNTEVAIPFLSTDNGYAILWDNYSQTRVGDSRGYLPLSALKLYSVDGEEGWLTARYGDIVKPESDIFYDDIPALRKLPEGFKMDKSTVTWEGAIESSQSGRHQILFKYSSYAKLWIDDSLLADRWRQAWNPGSALIPVELEKGKKHKIKIEWKPAGTQSYISFRWMPPAPPEWKNRLAFLSDAGNKIDYYFIAGAHMDELIAGYRELTGPAVLLPKWAYGKWQSRERYKTQAEILETVREYRKRKIPLDNIVLDWSYWKENDWGSHAFDSTRFPDVTGMIRTLHKDYHTHFMISVWPKFYKDIANYRAFNENGWLYKRNIAVKNLDWIGKGYVSTFYDAFSEGARKLFWKQLNEQLFSKGVDAWWLDASEPDIFSNLPVEERKLMMSPTALGSGTEFLNAYPLVHSQGVYEGQRATDPSKRVFILTRSAYGGLQRYAAATWSGDIGARWEDFRAQISGGVNFSLSGLPYWTHDIGGFSVEPRLRNAKSGPDREEWQELMTRWYQFGVFTPLFRVHGEFPFREIFNVAEEGSEAYASMVYYDKLRYRLMPYIYSLAGDAWLRSGTMMRGLVMDFNDPAVKNIDDQYMFGPAFLVAPVTSYKQRERKVYLPEGANWYDAHSGEYIRGGNFVTGTAPMGRLPLFLREGSIVPVGPELQYTAEKKADTITLWVYTGKDATFTLYEDEDLNYNYEKGQFSVIHFRYNEADGSLTISDREGSFPGMLKKRVFRVKWVDTDRAVPFDPAARADASVRYTGKEIRVSRK